LSLSRKQESVNLLNFLDARIHRHDFEKMSCTSISVNTLNPSFFSSSTTCVSAFLKVKGVVLTK